MTIEIVVFPKLKVPLWISHMIIDLDTSLIHFPHATFGLRALEPIIFRARFGVKSDGALIFALGFAFQLPFTIYIYVYMCICTCLYLYEDMERI